MKLNISKFISDLRFTNKIQDVVETNGPFLFC